MLAKQYWRICTEPQSFIAKTFKAKYFPKGCIQNCLPKSHHSWFWRKILDQKNTKLKESKWLVRNGFDIPLKHLAWFSCGDQFIQYHNLNSGTVSNLIDHSAHTWKPDLIRSLYPHTISAKILKTPISKVGAGQDKLLWKHSKSGKYQPEKAYNLLLVDHNSMSSAYTSTLSMEASLTIQSLICRYQVAFNNQNTF